MHTRERGAARGHKRSGESTEPLHPDISIYGGLGRRGSGGRGDAETQVEDASRRGGTQRRGAGAKEPGAANHER